MGNKCIKPAERGISVSLDNQEQKVLRKSAKKGDMTIMSATTTLEEAPSPLETPQNKIEFLSNLNNEKKQDDI